MDRQGQLLLRLDLPAAFHPFSHMYPASRCAVILDLDISSRDLIAFIVNGELWGRYALFYIYYDGIKQFVIFMCAVGI